MGQYNTWVIVDLEPVEVWYYNTIEPKSEVRMFYMASIIL